MWERRKVVRKKNSLKLIYGLTAPLEYNESLSSTTNSEIPVEPLIVHRMNSEKKKILADRFFNNSDSSVSSIQLKEETNTFEEIVQNIRSFNRSIAQKFGFNLGVTNCGRLEEKTTKISIDLDSTTETTPSPKTSFGTTQWDNSRSDICVL